MTTMKPSQIPEPCPICKVRHVKNDQHIEIIDPDDEIVGHGFFHVERLSDQTVWIGFTDPDGGHVALEVYCEQGESVEMYVRDER